MMNTASENGVGFVSLSGNVSGKRFQKVVVVD